MAGIGYRLLATTCSSALTRLLVRPRLLVDTLYHHGTNSPQAIEGPSSACIPRAAFRTPIAYQSAYYG